MFVFIHCFWEFFWFPNKVFTYVFFELLFGALVFVCLFVCCNKHVCSVSRSYPTIYNPLETTAQEAPLCMGYSWQEYWSMLPFPPPGDLPSPRIEPMSHVSCIVGWFFTSHLVSPLRHVHTSNTNFIASRNVRILLYFYFDIWSCRFNYTLTNTHISQPALTWRVLILLSSPKLNLRVSPKDSLPIYSLNLHSS